MKQEANSPFVMFDDPPVGTLCFILCVVCICVLKSINLFFTVCKLFNCLIGEKDWC